MKATYNVTGAARKELVKVIGSTLGTKPVYKFMPTCAFEIGAITVEKDGTMVWDERTDEATIQAVIAALAAAGFTAEIEGEAAPEAEGLQEAAHEAEDAKETDDAEEGDRLTIALPKDGFTDGSIENLSPGNQDLCRYPRLECRNYTGGRHPPGLSRTWPQPAGRRLHPHLVWPHMVTGALPADQCPSLEAGTIRDRRHPPHHHGRHCGWPRSEGTPE